MMTMTLVASTRRSTISVRPNHYAARLQTSISLLSICSTTQARLNAPYWHDLRFATWTPRRPLCRLDSFTTSTIFHFGKAKCYFEFKYFTAFIYFRRSSRILFVSVTFADLLHMFLPALLIPPPWYGRGLDLVNLRVARPVGSYLLLSHVRNPPPRHARMLG
jgi:hypothetical protein